MSEIETFNTPINQIVTSVRSDSFSGINIKANEGM